MKSIFSDIRRHIKIVSDITNDGFTPILKEYDVKGISYVSKSLISGNGVFASRDIPSGTHLIGTENRSYYHIVVERCFESLLNDIDMIYPTDWSYRGLLNTFTLYIDKNNCNIDTNSMITIKDIRK